MVPRGSRTARMASMFVPVIIEELQEVPEEIVNQATAFMLLALARVQNPNARRLVVDVENRAVLAAEQLPAAEQLENGESVRYYVVRADEQAPAVPALPDAEMDGGDRDGSAAAGA
jgi:hypothetical protein